MLAWKGIRYKSLWINITLEQFIRTGNFLGISLQFHVTWFLENYQSLSPGLTSNMWNHDSRFLYGWIFVYIFCLINVRSAIFFPSPLPLGFVGFSPLMFSVWQVPVPFLSCGASWLGCAVVPVMGALFSIWLPIVEAPGPSCSKLG